MVPVLLTMQVPMLMEYITEFRPLLAKPGLNKPPGVTALLPSPVHVPVGGLAVKVTGEKILQREGGMVMEGVKGLLMVMPTVLVIGQFNWVELTVTVYGMVASVTLVGSKGGMMAVFWEKGEKIPPPVSGCQLNEKLLGLLPKAKLALRLTEPP